MIQLSIQWSGSINLMIDQHHWQGVEDYKLLPQGELGPGEFISFIHILETIFHLGLVSTSSSGIANQCQAKSTYSVRQEEPLELPLLLSVGGCLASPSIVQKVV